MPYLSILIALPLVGALVVALLPKRRPELVFPMGIIATAPQFFLVAYLVTQFATGSSDLQFGEDVVLSSDLGISWLLGMDGISIFMVAISALLFPLALGASKSVSVDKKRYTILLLVLQAGVFGVFLSLDLLVFFAFFELVLLPMFLLIRLWGSENRAYASIKFVLFTAVGSAFLLASIVALAVITGDQVGSFTSFDFRNMLQTDLSSTTQMWLFAGFAIAFLIKVPVFPFHTWLADAHTEAPTAGSVILAGVLLKMGTYGLLRFNMTLFPEATVDFGPWIAGLGVIGIIYGGAVAIVQKDLKRLVAYSSVSHMGFIILGMFALTSQGLSGSVFLAYSHGLTTGMLFLLVGMIYDRTHTRLIADYGGLAKVMPVFAGLFLFASFASAGLPGLSGFIGEFAVLIGSYLTLPVLAVLAGSGVILAAIYLLWAYERVFTGPVTNPKLEALSDLGAREIFVVAYLVLLIVFHGVHPAPFFDRIDPSVELILDRIEATTEYEAPDFGRTDDFPEPAYGEIDTHTDDGHGETGHDEGDGSDTDEHGEEG